LKIVSVVLLCMLAAAAHAQPRERVDATLPERASRERGDRVLDTRPLRDASEARLREELLRQAEIDALVDARQTRAAGLMPIYPSVYPFALPRVQPPIYLPGTSSSRPPDGSGPGPCAGARCPRPPAPMPR
jgi:hypothetical protein